VHQVMETHETLALITLGVFGVLALWRIVRRRRMGNGERSLALLLSVAGLGVLFVTANYGGRLVFDHAAAIPSRVLQTELRERSEGHHHHGEETAHPMEMDSAAPPAAGHVDPPGTPPHTHPPGTAPHKD